MTGRHAGLPKRGDEDRQLISPATLMMHPLRWIKLATALRAAMPQYRPGSGNYRFLGPDRSKPPFQVMLEPDAGRWLSRDKALPRRVTDPGDRIDVWLDCAARPSGESPIRVHVQKRLAGVLRPDDGAVFRSDVERAQLSGFRVMTSGYRSSAEDGTLQFYVYQP
jgi:hypothetical protein